MLTEQWLFKVYTCKPDTGHLYQGQTVTEVMADRALHVHATFYTKYNKPGSGNYS